MRVTKQPGSGNFPKGDNSRERLMNVSMGLNLHEGKINVATPSFIQVSILNLTDPIRGARRKSSKRAGGNPMTVCVAAICSWPGGGSLIFGASDRMLSAPDIKFEPPQAKIYLFTEKVVALTAGDPYAQSAICQEVSRAQALKPRKTVREFAELYAEALSKYRREVAEAKYLKPLGLDANSFMDRSQDFKSDLVSDLRIAMQREELDVETIVAGVDADEPHMPHLYVVNDPGVVSCADSIGFAAIGSGKHHADSHFMMAKHTTHTTASKAMLDVYVAKRRSEISPTVGTVTDVFFIGGEGIRDLDYRITEKLENIYIDLEHRTKQVMAEAADLTNEFFASFVVPPESSEPTPEPTQPDLLNTQLVPRTKKKPITTKG